MHGYSILPELWGQTAQVSFSKCCCCYSMTFAVGPVLLRDGLTTNQAEFALCASRNTPRVKRTVKMISFCTSTIV